MFGIAQPLALAFPYERPAFLREYLTGTYDITPYLISKLCSEVPFAVIQTLVGVTMGFFMMELQGSFVEIWVAILLLGLSASSVAMAIGAVASDVRTAMQLIPLAFVPQFLFSGFLVQIEQIPSFIRWAQWLCTLKYSLNLLLLAEFGDRNPENDALLEANDVERDLAWVYILVLLGLSVFFRMLAAAALKASSRRL